MRLITDIFEYCYENIPNWNTISISGYHVREAGCTAAQEIAFTLANGIAYVEAAIEAGLDVDDFAPRLSFFFNAHNNFLEEISKFRAARRLWAQIMEERFGAKKEKSKMLRFHTQTAGSTLTAQQSDNNVVRVTLQALAAVLGGTQSLHTNGRDEALSLPTEKSVEIALRTQQIIAHESGVADTADALGGSYYIEKLTDDLQEEAEEYINKIDDLGGAPEAIDQGYIQKEIQDSAYSYQKEIEAEKKIIVGVNKFKTEEEPKKDILKLDEKVANQQKERVSQLREDRDQAKVEKALKALKDTAETDQNLMPKIVDAVKAYATLGEVCDVMREVFGEYNENIIL
jgi:methylmalonyl-CoA mutase N-terminal domain/subunit